MDALLTDLDARDAALACRWATTAEQVLLFAGPRMAHPLTADALLAQVGPDHHVLGLHLPGRTAPGEAAELVATGQAWVVDEPTVRMGRLLVDPARRGQGLGRELVVRLVEHARQSWPSATRVTLGVYQHNAAARHLYRTLGFQEAGPVRSTPVGGQEWTS